MEKNSSSASQSSIVKKKQEAPAALTQLEIERLIEYKMSEKILKLQNYFEKSIEKESIQLKHKIKENEEQIKR